MEKLTVVEINENLKSLPSWVYSENKIEKEFKVKDFVSALSFVNKIGAEAEKMDHHPDILIHSWNKVKIFLSTHSAGGVTANDFNLANKIEKIA
ncbi:MAG TPA: 4a-hydroxytetrahydrobiopterin dehydratase [Ignavibacteriaceae bacterium]|nr:4a-hydroxytetrahydrobiopterin dehydratase [Ignavibacteriaceae bacterium]